MSEEFSDLSQRVVLFKRFFLENFPDEIKESQSVFDVVEPLLLRLKESENLLLRVQRSISDKKPREDFKTMAFDKSKSYVILVRMDSDFNEDSFEIPEDHALVGAPVLFVEEVEDLKFISFEKDKSYICMAPRESFGEAEMQELEERIQTLVPNCKVIRPAEFKEAG